MSQSLQLDSTFTSHFGKQALSSSPAKALLASRIEQALRHSKITESLRGSSEMQIAKRYKAQAPGIADIAGFLNQELP